MFLRRRGIGILTLRSGEVSWGGNGDGALRAGLRMGGRERCTARGGASVDGLGCCRSVWSYADPGTLLVGCSSTFDMVAWLALFAIDT